MKKYLFTKRLRHITIVLSIVLALLQEITECLSQAKEILLSICNIVKLMFG